MQKVTVLLDEKGIPKMDDLPTMSVVEAICGNFNALYKMGLVILQVEREALEVQHFSDPWATYSIHQAYKPHVRLIPAPGNGAVLQIIIQT